MRKTQSIFYCTKARDPSVKVTNEMFGTTFFSLFSCGRLNIELSMDVCNESKLVRVSFISKGTALRYKSLTKNTSVIFETQFTTECDLLVLGDAYFLFVQSMNNMNLSYYVKEESVVCTILWHKHLRLETIYNIYTVNTKFCLGERDKHFPWLVCFAPSLYNYFYLETCFRLIVKGKTLGFCLSSTFAMIDDARNFEK